MGDREPMNELRAALRRELTMNFGIRAPFDDDTELFTSGLLDSLSIMDLVGFVERLTGRPVSPEQVTMENFGSISRIARFAGAGGSRP